MLSNINRKKILDLWPKISNGARTHQADIVLVIGVILISLLSFALGYITAKTQEKQPIKFEIHENSYNWSGNSRTLFIS
ncbi:MAG: hypothetical protein Q8P63_00965 [Candidatus Nealsonbacteria bacterium]|nr:hypothetical protein [Candidatus Nealsonbacteria bacterium]